MKRRWARLGALVCFGMSVLCGCAGQAGTASDGSKAQASGYKGTWEKTADARVGRYTSSPWTFSTVAYWVEGPEGVVVIDTGFVTSAAREIIAIAEKETGKKVVAALVLHANPDKFNGTATFQAQGAKVLTSDQVIALIPKIHEKRIKAFYERYKPDYPKELPQPSSFGAESREIELAGLRFKLHVMGAGCSEAHVVVQFEEHLFVGDLVANKAHSWLEIGRTDAWLERVGEMEALGARYIHPGRGPSGGPELLAAERAYLQKVMDLVAAEQPTLPPSKEGLARVAKQMEAAYPGYDFSVFLEIGLPAEWKRQAEARAKPQE